MTRTRKIIAAVAAIIAATLIAGVVYVWHTEGCGLHSLIAGSIMHAGMVFAVWATIDNTLKERETNN